MIIPRTPVKSVAELVLYGCQVAPSIHINPERTVAITDTLTALWETSVRASHSFLCLTDIEGLLPVVKAGIAEIETLVVAYDRDLPTAFMGIEAEKVEMLFVSPEYFGQGIGRELMSLARGHFAVKYVDVNEQNPAATDFYLHLGFEVFERSECDGQGNPFPILKLKLK